MSTRKKSSNDRGDRVAIGIDFGTTNSLVVAHSALANEKIKCFDHMESPHPSIVWYRQNDTPIVGRDAKEQVNSFADTTGNRFVRSIKRSLGKGTDIEVFGENRSTVDVATDLFRHLKDHAAEEHNVAIEEAVVTVPIYMGGAARRELRNAADKAGIFITTFIHEPFAALFAYLTTEGGNLIATDHPKNCLVFDWGGGTLDITVVRLQNGRAYELAVSGLDDLAGDYFDEVICQMARRKLCETVGIAQDELNLSRRSMDVLNARAERAKIQLTNSANAVVEVAGFTSVNDKLIDLSVSITRREFEAAIESEVKKAINRVNMALGVAGLTPEQVDLALLVGGTSRIPLVAEKLREMFGSSIRSVANADSLIAEGAAIISSLGFVPEFASTVQIELSTYNEADVMFPIFEAGRPAIPEACSRDIEMFCTDPRSGLARLVIGTECAIRATYERLQIISIPVSSSLPKPYDQEGVQVKVSLDEDLVVNIDAWSDTQSKIVHGEIVNLRYSLPLREEVGG